MSTTTTSTTQCRPGHGYGDRNHCHSGPPGRHSSTKAGAAHHSSSHVAPRAKSAAKHATAKHAAAKHAAAKHAAAKHAAAKHAAAKHAPARH